MIRGMLSFWIYICRCLRPDRTWHKVNDPNFGLKWGFRGGEDQARTEARTLLVQCGPEIINLESSLEQSQVYDAPSENLLVTMDCYLYFLNMILLKVPVSTEVGLAFSSASIFWTAANLLYTFGKGMNSLTMCEIVLLFSFC